LQTDVNISMIQKEFKFANELYWQVKGHLIPKEWADDELQVRTMMNSYFIRLWGNHEAVIHLEGFEQAWEQRYGNLKDSTT
jgi:hypothetical protein